MTEPPKWHPIACASAVGEMRVSRPAHSHSGALTQGRDYWEGGASGATLESASHAEGDMKAPSKQASEQRNSRVMRGGRRAMSVCLMTDGYRPHEDGVTSTPCHQVSFWGPTLRPG